MAEHQQSQSHPSITPGTHQKSLSHNSLFMSNDSSSQQERWDQHQAEEV